MGSTFYTQWVSPWVFSKFMEELVSVLSLTFIRKFHTFRMNLKVWSNLRFNLMYLLKARNKCCESNEALAELLPALSLCHNVIMMVSWRPLSMWGFRFKVLIFRWPFWILSWDMRVSQLGQWHQHSFILFWVQGAGVKPRKLCGGVGGRGWVCVVQKQNLRLERGDGGWRGKFWWKVFSDGRCMCISKVKASFISERVTQSYRSAIWR